jgi:hypothetical protein
VGFESMERHRAQVRFGSSKDADSRQNGAILIAQVLAYETEQSFFSAPKTNSIAIGCTSGITVSVAAYQYIARNASCNTDPAIAGTCA